MGTGKLIQGENLSDVKSSPSRIESLIESAARLDLRLRRYDIAANKKESGVHKDELPNWNFRLRSIGGVGRNRTALRQYLDIRIDVRCESDLDDVIDSIRSRRPDSFRQLFTGQQNFICSCPRCDFLVALAAARGNDSCSRPMRELNGTSSNRPCTALHQNGSSLDRSSNMNSPVSGYARYAEASSLLQRRAFGKLSYLSQGNHGVLGGGSERTVTLSAITPHAPRDPFPRHSFADCVNCARTVAVRNDTWIWHPDAKAILTFLHIARIHT